jgi:hypothetical protein
MRTVAEHLDRIREKPHHVRHRYALGTAGAITAVIGAAWLGISLSTGAFALHGTSFADATRGDIETSTPGEARAAAVAGAAAAPLPPAGEGAPARVEAVPTTEAKPEKAGKAEPTIIPF